MKFSNELVMNAFFEYDQLVNQWSACTYFSPSDLMFEYYYERGVFNYFCKHYET